MIKKILVLAVSCALAAPVYAGVEEDHASCMKAMTKGDKLEDNTPEQRALVEKWCDCLVTQVNLLKESKATNVDSSKVSQSCYLTASLHQVTDNLKDDATPADLMTACQGMMNVGNYKASGEDLKKLNTFCQCAQPKLADLWEKSDSMSDKDYDAGLYSMSEKCSAGL